MSTVDTARERRFERVVAFVLTAGVATSLALIVAGGCWTLLRPPEIALTRPFDATNVGALAATQVQRALRGQFGPGLLVNLGIVVLLLTPYTRVLASLVFFAFVERNSKYTLITGFVFVVLTRSLL